MELFLLPQTHDWNGKWRQFGEHVYIDMLSSSCFRHAVFPFFHFTRRHFKSEKTYNYRLELQIILSDRQRVKHFEPNECIEFNRVVHLKLLTSNTLYFYHSNWCTVWIFSISNLAEMRLRWARRCMSFMMDIHNHFLPITQYNSTFSVSCTRWIPVTIWVDSISKCNVDSAFGCSEVRCENTWLRNVVTQMNWNYHDANDHVKL